ncbi:GntR family transcriptional regulator [uncultured Algibacter sp.]|uniref:GntR family transcriptional regulator n=1 Tax=uncultured Algibacter sp. TaxID=298659 RepID=UPI002615D755|nr:GntR family transcriptional regulator [uncultured Algibacter sp.]
MIDYIRVDADSMVPKYMQIINSIISNIANGNAKVGDKIPSINKLSQEFYLSRDTVERAYRVLKKRKVIVSVHGRGTYIAENQLVCKLKVLFFVNKLSPYKMMIYNSFLKEMGENCQVDIHSYHCDETLFIELMSKYKSSYDYYIILPHFRTENLSYTSFTDRVNSVINSIPKEKLILLDNSHHQIEGNFIEVYQDFENDIYTALEAGQKKIAKYHKLTLVYPKKAFYPYPIKILDGFRKYCSHNNFDFEIIEEITSGFRVNSKNLYITIEEEDLVNLINQINNTNFILGSDIGVISYNDTPLKQVLDVTVISTDFDAIGKQTAKMITENKKEKVKAPFYFMDRGSV